MLARIVQMVADAQRSRAPIHQLVDQVAGWFVPAVILVAILAFIVWSIFGPEPSMAFALVSAVSVLIIADRKSVVEGKSESVRIEFSGRRSIQKNNITLTRTSKK